MSQPDYFDVAVSSAREYARRLEARTHWTTYDMPVYRGRQLAACGAWVSVKKISPDPTCPACRQQLAIFEALQF